MLELGCWDAKSSPGAHLSVSLRMTIFFSRHSVSQSKCLSQLVLLKWSTCLDFFDLSAKWEVSFQGASVFWLLKLCEVCYLGMLRSTVCVFRCSVSWLQGTANGCSLKTFHGNPKVVTSCESYSSLFVAFPSAVLTELFHTWKEEMWKCVVPFFSF